MANQNQLMVSIHFEFIRRNALNTDIKFPKRDSNFDAKNELKNKQQQQRRIVKFIAPLL